MPPGPYTVPDLAGDVLALADSLGIERFGVVGLSLGGAIAQTLTVTVPSRVLASVLLLHGPGLRRPGHLGTQAGSAGAGLGHGRAGRPDPRPLVHRRVPCGAPRAGGHRFIAMITGTDPEGYASCWEALSGFDLRAALPGITVPVRVLAGAKDPVAPPAACAEMASAIPGADLVVVDDASHIASVAPPDAFNAAVAEHLGRHL